MHAIIIASTDATFTLSGPVVECYTLDKDTISPADLSKLLLEQGWPDHDIREYLGKRRLELQVTDQTDPPEFYLVHIKPVFKHIGGDV